MPKGIYKHKSPSKETIRKISEAQKGRKFSEEQKRNMSKARLVMRKRQGYINSPETRKKISEALRGRPTWNKGKRRLYKHSEEAKRKISKALEGRIPWNKGKYHSKETKRKMSGAKMGKKHWNYGKHSSKETITQMSEAQRGHIAWNKGKKGLYRHTKESKRKIRKWARENFEILSKAGSLSCQRQWYSKGPTSIEKKVYDELRARGLLFEKQKLINGKFLVDAWIPDLNLIIEADGDYWHSLPKAIKRDKAKNAYLKKCGFNLLRLTETEINDGSFKNKLSEVN